jgi:signal transduction histidine kinase
MEIVGEEVEGLRRLVVEFSEFARLPVMDPQPTHVADFVDEVLRTNPQFAEYLAEFRGNEVDQPALIDHAMMRRVLVNLLENSRDAVNEARRSHGGDLEGSIKVAVVAAPAAGRVVIEVTDDGVGVATDDIPRLFDPYFTTKSDGTGLGLSIVKKIVLEHKGNIAVESPVRDNGGTRVLIDLPVSGEPEVAGQPAQLVRTKT